jgi:hypothetical protein
MRRVGLYPAAQVTPDGKALACVAALAPVSSAFEKSRRSGRGAMPRAGGGEMVRGAEAGMLAFHDKRASGKARRKRTGGEEHRQSIAKQRAHFVQE